MWEKFSEFFFSHTSQASKRSCGCVDDLVFLEGDIFFFDSCFLEKRSDFIYHLWFSTDEAWGLCAKNFQGCWYWWLDISRFSNISCWIRNPSAYGTSPYQGRTLRLTWEVEEVGDVLLSVCCEDIVYLWHDVCLCLLAKDLYNICIGSAFIYEMLEESDVGWKATSGGDEEVVFVGLTICIMSNWSGESYLIAHMYVLSEKMGHTSFWYFFYHESDLFGLLHLFVGRRDAIGFFDFFSLNLCCVLIMTVSISFF